jgi:hypothetical protein
MKGVRAYPLETFSQSQLALSPSASLKSVIVSLPLPQLNVSSPLPPVNFVTLATIYLVISTSSRTDKGVPKVNIISLSTLYLVVSTITIAGNATVTKEAAKNATSLR